MRAIWTGGGARESFGSGDPGLIIDLPAHRTAGGHQYYIAIGAHVPYFQRTPWNET